MAVYITYNDQGKIESIFGESSIIELDRIIKEIIEEKYDQ